MNKYVEFELLEDFPAVSNKSSLYPHDGVFLIRRYDGSLSVVNVERGEEGNFCKSYSEAFIGSCTVLDTDMISKEEFDKKVADITQQYEQRLHELQLKHESELAAARNDAPKRNGQGEWVSGKTLTEIIRILTGEVQPIE